MAAYPELTVADLAGFSGRSVASYPAMFSTSALVQSTLLFKIATCLANLPESKNEQDLAKMAILAFAEHLILAQPFAKVAASPFNSESLGSYSYSKGSAAFAKAALAATKGEKSGVMWFDVAVERLGTCWDINGLDDFGGIEIFEHDGEFVPGSDEANFRFLSPQDVNKMSELGFIISRT